MISPGVIGSVRLQKEPSPCAQCGSTSRVGRGLCLNCLLYRGLGEETYDNETLEGVLDEVDVRDADWRLGNYQILEEIGRGGMGVIYRARQRHSRRIVAVKRILAYHADTRETLLRFRREAEAAASLDHPNILAIYEVGESDDGLPYFSMKLATGGSLLESHVALHKDPRRSVALMAKVTRAVQCAHARGILHRDLKPGNILLDGRGEPMVSDFGLAKWLDAKSDLTRTLTIFGTPGYIAPEQAHGPAAGLKPTADIYSLGAILFDLLAGRPPFIGDHALSVIQQAAEKSAPKLRSLKPILDRDLETICARCLDREPAARYDSAGDLAEDLERWLEGRPIIARPVSPPVRIWRWSKRNPKLAGSIAACLILGGIAGGFKIQSRLSERAAAVAMHSIAVEPFLDLDSASYDATTSNAIAATLQNELSKRGPARVMPISSENFRAIANDSQPRWNGVRTAMQGTKRIRDDKLRLSLRLLNTADGKVLYKKIFEADRPQTASTLVSQAIASQLYAILNIADLSSAEPTENDPGWRDSKCRELIVSGNALFERRTRNDVARAEDLFRKAVAEQPDSALAHSLLSGAASVEAFLGVGSNRLAEAEAAAKTAVSLNDKLSDAHKAMSMVLFLRGEFYQSLEDGLVAMELADETIDVRLIARLSSNLRTLGQPAKAAAWYRLALTKGDRPFDTFLLADCYADMGDDERASEAYQRAASLFPELPEGWMGLCRLALLHRDFASARKIASENWTKYRDYLFSEQMAAEVAFFSRDFPEAERLYAELAAKDSNGGGSFYGCVSYESALGYLRLAMHDQKGGIAILKKALDKERIAFQAAPHHPEILYRLAALESSLGQKDAALSHLQAATQEGYIDYRSLDIDPRFDVIRSDSRYQRISETMVTRVASLRGPTPTEKVATVK